VAQRPVVDPNAVPENNDTREIIVTANVGNRGDRGFNINDFRSAISKRNGPLRPTLYQVTFTKGTFIDDFFTFSTERVELPDLSLDTEKIRRYGYGPLEDVPFRPVFQPLRMTIIAPADNKVGIIELINKISTATPFNKSTGERYSIVDDSLPVSTNNGITSTAYPYEVAYKDDIKFTTTVSIYNSTGTKGKIIEYNFVDCFLRAMSPIQLDWNATDQYVKVDMTLGYTDFYTKSDF
jgi:hypothetical protein